MGVKVGCSVGGVVCGVVGKRGDGEELKWGLLGGWMGMIVGGRVFEILKKK